MGKVKEIIKNNLNIVILVAIITFVILLTVNEGIREKGYQGLNQIDYNVSINSDGSMRITETWDIYVSHTNTLFKTFDLDKTKFENITDVSVVDLETGKNFTEIYEEEYHVPDGKYYGLNINTHQFEIAFGVGMDAKSGNRKFQIAYTVNDVIADYKDCQELYWQFLAEGQNTIPAKKVTGTVTLPNRVSNIDNLLVWGHGPLNGEIKREDPSTVKFELNNLRIGQMIEIRVITKEKMFETSINRVHNYSNLERTIKEETKWAEEAENESNSARKIILVVLIIYLVLLVKVIFKIKKLLKRSKEDYVIEKNKLKYFRDIPREETATPAEANYLYRFSKTRLSNEEVQRNTISATILDLCYKKKITLDVREDKIYIQVVSDSQGLQEDELQVYNLLKSVSKNNEEFEIEELNEYARKHYNKYSTIVNKFANSARNSLYNLKLIDKAQEREYSRTKTVKSKIELTTIFYAFPWLAYLETRLPIFTVTYNILLSNLWVYLLALLPAVVLNIWKWKLQEICMNKIAVLTQEGREEKAKWTALKRYLEDYSLIEEKEVPSLVIWEKYLIYATAFGVADKVIEQMKAKYPEVFIQENWDDENMKSNYPIIYFSMNPYYHYHSSTNIVHSISRLEKGVSRAYNTSITEIARHTSSSGSGSSRKRRPEEASQVAAEAGGGRWPEWEADNK